jgi:uncharacterized protein
LSQAAWYLDSSALVKLVVPEAETQALMAALAASPKQVSSEIACVEVRRAVRRSGSNPLVAQRAEAILGAIDLVRFNVAIRELAGRLDPGTLRSLDAIHLATALWLSKELVALVTYDGPQAGAARAAGLTVLSPA